jgi:hypothetical protein
MLHELWIVDSTPYWGKKTGTIATRLKCLASEIRGDSWQSNLLLLAGHQRHAQTLKDYHKEHVLKELTARNKTLPSIQDLRNVTTKEVADLGYGRIDKIYKTAIIRNLSGWTQGDAALLSMEDRKAVLEEFDKLPVQSEFAKGQVLVPKNHSRTSRQKDSDKEKLWRVMENILASARIRNSQRLCAWSLPSPTRGTMQIVTFLASVANP